MTSTEHVARRLAIAMPSSVPAAEIVAIARRAEAAGYDEIWVTDEYFAAGPIAQAAAILGATRRTSVGIGILSTGTRHAATIAMESATLGGLWPGRLTLGLGVGHGPRLGQMGIDASAATADFDRCLLTVRRLLRGEAVGFVEGGPRDVTLRTAPLPAPPVLAAAVGPQGLRRAAAAADGAVLSWLSGPSYIRWARACMQAETNAPSTIVTIALTALDVSADDAVARARSALERFVPGAPRRLLSAAGVDPDEGVSDEPVPLDAARIRELSVAGDVSGCTESLKAIWSAGADLVVLYPSASLDLEQLVGDLGGELVAACR